MGVRGGGGRTAPGKILFNLGGVSGSYIGSSLTWYFSKSGRLSSQCSFSKEELSGTFWFIQSEAATPGCGVAYIFWKANPNVRVENMTKIDPRYPNFLMEFLGLRVSCTKKALPSITNNGIIGSKYLVNLTSKLPTMRA